MAVGMFDGDVLKEEEMEAFVCLLNEIETMLCEEDLGNKQIT